MAAARRILKQALYGGAFLAIVGGLSASIWITTRPKPSCTDGILNQDEQGVDCGGVCALACRKEPAYPSATVRSATIFEVAPYTYDVLGELENQNTDFGFSALSYEFTVRSATGIALETRRGTAYLMPGERTFVAEQRLQTRIPAVSAELTTRDEAWTEIAPFPPIDLFVRDKAYGVSGGAGGRVTGVVVNRSGYDFERVDIVVTLKDEAGVPIGAGTTDVRVLNDGDSRAFEVRWPTVPRTPVATVDTQLTTNILTNENFLVRYGKSREQYQQELPVPPNTRLRLR